MIKFNNNNKKKLNLRIIIYQKITIHFIDKIKYYLD